ncbi:MAG: DUF1080 domain-containing protein, partial [Thermoguttaceae bacterium]
MQRGVLLRAVSLKHHRWALAVLAVVLTAAAARLYAVEWLSGIWWQMPPVVEPGTNGGPPSDAVVLFDGKDMSQWNKAEKWVVQDGCVTSGGNDIQSKQSFGDCQLHVEWASPEKVVGSGQGRGNSGVFMMGLYEIQVLDSYQNETYADGAVAAIYKQHPPLVNASRKPGQWQTYDILWEAPRFDDKGAVAKPACVTVLHNGVVAQNHFQVLGETAWDHKPEYKSKASKGPIGLQFHGNPVRFRNIWVREIKEL